MPAPPLRRRKPRHCNQVRAVSSKEFKKLAVDIIKAPISSKTHYRRFRRTFGLSPRQVSILWAQLVSRGCIDFLVGPRNRKPIHLLWTLLFLKGYGIEENNAPKVGASEKTFRKWTWIYAEAIASLDKIFVSVVTMLRSCLAARAYCCFQAAAFFCFGTSNFANTHSLRPFFNLMTRTTFINRSDGQTATELVAELTTQGILLW